MRSTSTFMYTMTASWSHEPFLVDHQKTSAFHAAVAVRQGYRERRVVVGLADLRDEVDFLQRQHL